MQEKLKISYLQIRFTVGWKIIQPVISICKLLNFFIFQTKTVHNLPLIFGCSGLGGCFTFLSFSQEQISYRIGTDSTQHSMTRENLNKNEDLLKNTTAASKYIPGRKIYINWNPPPSLLLNPNLLRKSTSKCEYCIMQQDSLQNSFWTIYEVRSESGISIHADSRPPRY